MTPGMAEIPECPNCLGGAARDTDTGVPPDGDAIRCERCAPPAAGYYWLSRDARLMWTNFPRTK